MTIEVIAYTNNEDEPMILLVDDVQNTTESMTLETYEERYKITK